MMSLDFFDVEKSVEVAGAGDDNILADLAAFERGLGDAGTGEKIVRKGGPLSVPAGDERPNCGLRLLFNEF